VHRSIQLIQQNMSEGREQTHTERGILVTWNSRHEVLVTKTMI